MDALQAALRAAGLDALIPTLLACHALASALDALIPQPAPGSHWLPLRKLVSIAAGNVHYAGNALQPSVLTWVERSLPILMAILPSPTVVAAPTPAPAPAVTPPAPLMATAANSSADVPRVPPFPLPAATPPAT